MEITQLIRNLIQLTLINNNHLQTDYLTLLLMEEGARGWCRCGAKHPNFYKNKTGLPEPVLFFKKSNNAILFGYKCFFYILNTFF